MLLHAKLYDSQQYVKTENICTSDFICTYLEYLYQQMIIVYHCIADLESTLSRQWGLLKQWRSAKILVKIRADAILLA